MFESKTEDAERDDPAKKDIDGTRL